MPLIRCKCGRHTNNGFLCTSCQKDSSINSLDYSPEIVDEEEDPAELGYSIVDGLEDMSWPSDLEDEED